MTQQRKYSPYKVGTVSITCNSSLMYLEANKKTLLPLLTLFTLFKQLQSKKAVMPRYTDVLIRLLKNNVEMKHK